ncbi:hypothetical protein [Pseudogemmobacter sp. W21_MBD1_M6]|uniref:hypothetical protein n=1 Tax=Pseudogemmobacter sp. W21_MBD1_M6 TaxID=3240271 RepID=UPI003F953663
MSLEQKSKVGNLRPDEQRFLEFLQAATHNDHYMYSHSGARCSRRLMDLVRLQANCGLVNLAQKRDQTGFQYLAIRTRERYFCPD